MVVYAGACTLQSCFSNLYINMTVLKERRLFAESSRSLLSFLAGDIGLQVRVLSIADTVKISLGEQCQSIRAGTVLSSSLHHSSQTQGYLQLTVPSLGKAII